MDEWQNKLIEQAGPLGAALGVVVLTAGAVLARAKGWLGLGAHPKKDEPRSESGDEIMKELRAITSSLGAFDARIKEIEHDLVSRPTRQDLHGIETTLARQDERMKAMEKTAVATNASVLRIEDYLYKIASGK